MNRAQIVVLGVALAAGAGAFVMINNSAPPPVTSVMQAAPQAQAEQVLVANRDLSYGVELTDSDTAWIDWPKNGVPGGTLTKSDAPNAKEDIKSSYVRIPISNGEPVRRDRLIKGATAGLMSTMIAPGKRAIAIDVAPNTTAGGFVLPNDRVDVMRTYRDAELTKDLGHEVVASEVVLLNVRVLAMGQTIEKKGNDPVVSGATATLELDPHQAELVVLAQRTGQLALSLRPITDAIAKDASAELGADETAQIGMMIVRHGVPATMRAK